MLRAKLPFLKRWNDARARNAARYTEVLGEVSGVVVPTLEPDEEAVWNQYTIRCRQAEVVRAALTAARVEWRHFYPTPAYRQEAIGALRLPDGACPETERACREVISLPVYPTLSGAALARVAEIVARAAPG